MENADPTGCCEEVGELRYALLLDGRTTREAVGRTGERVALELEDDGQRVQVRIGLRYAEEDRACEVRIEGDPVVLQVPQEASRG
ncbi:MULTISPECIES: hypothetical protein [Actinosynnema]|uniref:hypothetical protein n=1 Tax=Actinosynnema TaxID=40566 RepID=UPI0020A3573A|nr:hypothetical protein [Actinosynnema pretiosum]MCP2095634.1 hypothetical protein [Actinosynnema pretiosum]